jgi:hypothetical protein
VPYTLIEGTDARDIKEYEYASAKKEILFTAFTSCIGVIAKKGDILTGVHLVAVSNEKEAKAFAPNDVEQVLNVLALPADKVTVFGCIDVWRDPRNGTLSKAFEKLTGTLKTKALELYHQSLKDIGTYGAEIGAAGEIKIKFLNQG